MYVGNLMLPVLSCVLQVQGHENQECALLTRTKPGPPLTSLYMESFELPDSVALEEMPLFPQWVLPLRLMAFLMAGTFLYTFLRDVLQPFVTQNKNYFYKASVLFFLSLLASDKKL